MKYVSELTANGAGGREAFVCSWNPPGARTTFDLTGGTRYSMLEFPADVYRAVPPRANRSTNRGVTI